MAEVESPLIRALRQAVQSAPEQAEFRVALAGALIDAGDAEGAIVELGEVLRLEPDSAPARTLMLKALGGVSTVKPANAVAETADTAHLDRPDDALRVAAAGRERFPGSSEAARLHGRVLAEVGRHDEAVAAADAATALAAGNPRALTSVANVYKRLGLKDEAKAAYKAILREAPTETTALFELGSLYMLDFQDNRAAERLIERIELPDVGGDRTAVLGQIRYQLGKWDRAAADFEAAIATPMRAPSTVPGIITGLQLFGQPARFQPLRDKCVEIRGDGEPAEPVTIEKLRLATFMMLKHGALPQAHEVLRQILELDPGNYEATVMARVVTDPDEPDHAEALAVVFAPDTRDEEL